ncbi:MAG: methionyl-tRNA formyltransferase [Lentisphaeria bacterium]|nr:methionyl-tRNA formyltransferase [Lentisphaeria bacterium]
MNANRIKIVFAGAGPFASPVLESLLNDPGIEVARIVTQEDKPAGRKGILTPSPLGKWCEAQGIVFERIHSVNDPEFLRSLRETAPDLIVVVSFGQLLKEEILSLPPLGCLNVHASLLPKYRGASPIISVVLNGEAETGVSFMRMDKGLDTGPVYQMVTMPLSGETVMPDLELELAQLAGSHIGDCIRRIASGELVPVEQNHAEATVSRKVRKQHGAMDWHENAEILDRKIRAFQPWPSVTFAVARGEKTMLVKISQCRLIREDTGMEPGTVTAITKEGITVACREGALLLSRVIPEGKKEMGAADFARGFRIETGMIFLNGPGISAQ